MSAVDEPRVALGDVQLLLHGVDHAEGLAIDPDGTVWCGGEEGQIYRGPLDESPREIARLPGRPLGLALDVDGNAYCCCYSDCSAVYRITPKGETTVVASGTAESPCVAPNHPAFLADGTLLYTDSGNWRQNDGCIFSVCANGTVAVADTSASRYPNGLAMSPDGSFVAIVESTLPGVSALSVRADGRLGDWRVLVELPDATPDGVAFDVRGRLLVSCFRPDVIYLVDGASLEVLVFDPDRLLLNSPTNIAFVPGTSTVVCANYGERFLSVFEHDTPGAPLQAPAFPWTPSEPR